jgi:hypothetical protein
MKKRKANYELKKFRARLSKDTGKAYKCYLEAKKSYESAMKKFVIREISGEKGFTKFRSESLKTTREIYQDAHWSDVMRDSDAEIFFLEELISHHEYCVFIFDEGMVA